MNVPFYPANPGDPILSQDWNNMQIKTRDEIASSVLAGISAHAHSGGSDGPKLGGSAIDPAAVLSVQQVTASSALTVKGTSATSPGVNLSTSGIQSLATDQDIVMAPAGLGRLKVTNSGATQGISLSVSGIQAFGTTQDILITPQTNGGVGIGTSTLGGNKLSVQGNVNVTGDIKFTGNLTTTALGRVVPLYIRGSGGNFKVNNANVDAAIIIGSTRVAFAQATGLTLLRLNRSDHSVKVAATTYNTYSAAANSDSLAATLNAMTDEIGILVSWDAWEGNVNANLQTALRRLGLFKASWVQATYTPRQPYAAVFMTTGTANDPSFTALEVLHRDVNSPPAEIRGWLLDGAFVASGDNPAVQVNPSGASHLGTGFAARSGYMANGSLTIGSIAASFGGGTTNWNANTAGLLLETLADTEIAVHDSQTRVASMMFYQGDNVNRITIGRDMGWGITNTTVAGSLTVGGDFTPGYDSGWLAVNQNDGVDKAFPVPFFPLLLSVLVRVSTDGVNWVYTHIYGAKHSWDDLGTDNRTFYYMRGNTVYIRMKNAGVDSTLIDGAAPSQFRVYAWRTIGTVAP